ncbi:hypothetical protein ASA1KI_14470 [Opitutales bacterium ASA1]|uniref:hypothetical protein n=1 Tax=Congregicoccus parvus TaxID=3081749 RepID=UPI002B2BE517|nr:hypothetical protein ASA1KI_14470 [Opitutales bacterium ASA1]
MSIERDIEFLKTKIRLVGENRKDGPSPQFVTVFMTGVENLETIPGRKKARARMLDSTINEIAPHNCDWNSVNAELMAKFGFCRLGADPVTVVARVLKRGKIRSETEGRVIKDFVSNVENETTLGTADYDKLAFILDKWECTE